MSSRMRTDYPCGFNKGFSLRFLIDYSAQNTPVGGHNSWNVMLTIMRITVNNGNWDIFEMCEFALRQKQRLVKSNLIFTGFTLSALSETRIKENICQVCKCSKYALWLLCICEMLSTSLWDEATICTIYIVNCFNFLFKS